MVELTQPLAQIDPSVMDYIDMDGMAKHLIKVLAIPAVAIKSDEQVAQLRMQRAAHQQAMSEQQQQAQVMETAGKAAPMMKAMQPQ